MINKFHKYFLWIESYEKIIWFVFSRAKSKQTVLWLFLFNWDSRACSSSSPANGSIPSAFPREIRSVSPKRFCYGRFSLCWLQFAFQLSCSGTKRSRSISWMAGCHCCLNLFLMKMKGNHKVRGIRISEVLHLMAEGALYYCTSYCTESSPVPLPEMHSTFESTFNRVFRIFFLKNFFKSN